MPHRVLLAVSILVISVISVNTSSVTPSHAQVSAGLTEPQCFRHGFLKRKIDCTARDTWRLVKPILDRNSSDQAGRVAVAVLGPASSYNPSLVNILETTGTKPSCAAAGINAFLKTTVKIGSTVSGAQNLVGLALRLARGPLSGYSLALRTQLTQIWKLIAATATNIQVRATITNMAYCSA